MTLLTVGLNHRTAPLAVREGAAFPAEQFDRALDDLLGQPQVREGAILSTCNRTELYAVIDGETDAGGDAALCAWLCARRGLEPGEMAPYFYVYRERESVRHSVDDLQDVVEDNKRSRAAAADSADAMLDARIDEYLAWVDSRAANATIRAVRGQAEAAREAVMTKARRQLAAGRPPEQVLESATRSLANQLMHPPSAALRKADGARQQRLLGPARELFGLDRAPHSFSKDYRQ